MPPPPRMPIRTGEGTGVVAMGAPRYLRLKGWSGGRSGSGGRGGGRDARGGQRLGPLEVLGGVLAGTDRGDPLGEGVGGVGRQLDRDGAVAHVHAHVAARAEAVLERPGGSRDLSRDGGRSE